MLIFPLPLPEGCSAVGYQWPPHCQVFWAFLGHIFCTTWDNSDHAQLLNPSFLDFPPSCLIVSSLISLLAAFPLLAFSGGGGIPRVFPWPHLVRTASSWMISSMPLVFNYHLRIDASCIPISTHPLFASLLNGASCGSHRHAEAASFTCSRWFLCSQGQILAPLTLFLLPP